MSLDGCAPVLTAEPWLNDCAERRDLPQDAIDALNTLQTPFAVIEARRKAGIKPDESSITEIKAYWARLGHAVRNPPPSSLLPPFLRSSILLLLHLSISHYCCYARVPADLGLTRAPPPQPEDLDRLNVIHVAGTKGKGSVCAFVASILAQHQRARGLPRKIGLLTSPHLIAVRERIRLDGQPLSEDLFARYFFEVYDALSSSSSSSPAAADGPPGQQQQQQQQPGEPAPGSKPIYARYLTLLAFHVFLREGVDAAVVETGVGGEYDATNMVARPLAAGISTLGIDHVLVLGATPDEIAWHKAGILKPGRPGFAVEQVAFPSTEAVLRARAAERGVELRIVRGDDDDPRLRGVRVRPDAAFQRRNASLAVALAEAALEVLDPEGLRASQGGGEGKQGEEAETAGRLPAAFREGLERVVWRGRCEVKEETETETETETDAGAATTGLSARVVVRWHIDGAHTTDSLRVAARWFAGECEGRRGPRALVFNQQGRAEAVDFLEGLHAGSRRGDGSSFDRVVFCTNVTYAASGYKRGEFWGCLPTL